ncbi:MAG: molybdopterin cofactor-binding domain-containing protein, partial [Alphaproteobacteria bacterium]
NDAITIRIARSEIGQGSFTGLAMLVAEELECDWSLVKAEYASVSDHFKRNRIYRSMSTGGSRSIRDSNEYLRKAGAVARSMLIAAAAKQWKVQPGECTAANSTITHATSNRALRFGAVAAQAASEPAPAEIKLKDPKDWKLLGKSTKRLDIADKVAAKTVFAIDVRLPDMLYASIAQSPVFGGTLKSVNDAQATRIKGVQKIVSLPNAVAVIADNTWIAQRAVEALRIVWDEGPNAQLSSASIAAFLKEGLNASDAKVAKQTGDVKAALAGAAKIVQAEYAAPFLNHATMEPMNCTARFTPEKLEVWVPTQNGESSAAAAAEAAGLPLDKVEVTKLHVGGGFGRRGAFQDYVTQSVLIAKAVPGRPVKLTWTREEDMQHGFYRPVAMAKFVCGLDAKGEPIAWQNRSAGQSIIASVFPGRVGAGADLHALAGLHDMSYAFPNVLIDYAMRNTAVPVGFWRAVSHTQNTFFLESFIDEVAHAAGQDPYQFRRKLLAKAPREQNVLNVAAEKAGWGSKLAEGVFRGIAVGHAYGSYCAQVAEVSINQRGRLRVHRIVCALDTGHVVNPDAVKAQVEGSVVWGLTAALYGEITIKNGRVEQSNFPDYDMLRIGEMPKVEVHLVPTGGFWGGAGEPAVPPTAPAVLNAIFAATGKRIRSLPLKNHDLKKA